MVLFFILILMWPNLKPDLGSSQNLIHMPSQQKSDFASVCLFLLSNALFVCACVFSTRIEITQPEASFKLERDFTRKKKIGTFASRSSFCSFVTTSLCFLFNFWRETIFFFLNLFPCFIYTKPHYSYFQFLSRALPKFIRNCEIPILSFELKY